MSAVQLRIVEPLDGIAIIGDTPVTFRGELTELPQELEDKKLYYRWYSSLYEATKDHYSLNESALTDPGEPFSTLLSVGTHIITLGASDRAGQTEAEQEATQHGGVAGGSEGDGKCLVHVFKANMVAPTAGAEVRRSNAVLEAEAPPKWGQRPTEDDPYRPYEEYHKHNRLQYRWEFKPTGGPAGRQMVNFIPQNEQLVFDPEWQPIIIHYQGSLPSGIEPGAYTLSLHVEDKEDENIGHHQMSVNINVIN